MIKKHFVYLMLCSLFMINIAQAKDKTNTAAISGHLNFKPKTNQVTLHHVVDGKLEVHSTTIINESGDFGFQLPVTTPGFYFVDYGQYNNSDRGQNMRLYLEPGLDIQMDINEKDYALKGKNNGFNDLVNQANKINNEFRNYNRLGINVTFKDFYPFLENTGIKKVKDFIASINTKNKEFNHLLKLAVQADFETEAYFFFRLPRTAHPEKTDRPQLYADLKTNGIKFSDKDILKLDNGLRWMELFFYYYRYNSSEKVYNIDVINNDIKQISDNKLKEVYIMSMLEYLKLKDADYQKVIQPLYQYLTSDKSREYILEREKTMHQSGGQPGFEFTYEDINGKPVSFTDFKGKYVYIDVWATWCGPCKAQIPYLKKMEEDYHGKDIVFMSISVDKMKDKQKWKDFVKNEDLKGVQLMADQDFASGITKNYEIKGIPRFLLFDKEGKIITTDAMRPSDPLLREQFDKLLNASK